jgi:hypothetical protein
LTPAEELLASQHGTGCKERGVYLHTVSLNSKYYSDQGSPQCRLKLKRDVGPQPSQSEGEIVSVLESNRSSACQ